ncbi:hypothetical protein [Alicyclobacillus sp. SO9]|uniref:hypothetical protein n=1 Tax=Alicyclobacillus sp. SO9 TaxID=2665646 RepID=UPI0018E857A8|nr:hypothetical protein [Alicyclobacillus sp. SO9]QQE79865.1 hypothetical protein GI364_05105 [Alicyclobacillus sp. SO9]
MTSEQKMRDLITTAKNQRKMTYTKQQEVWNKIEQRIMENSEELPKGLQQVYVRKPDSRYRRTFGWVQGTMAVLAAVCVAAVVTIGVMKRSAPQYSTATPAEIAVQQYINKRIQPFLNKNMPGTVEKVTHNIATIPSGEFVATQTTTPSGNTHYRILFVSKNNGNWNFQGLSVKYDPKSKSLPAGWTHITNGFDFIGVGVPKKLTIAKVTVDVRLENNQKATVFSLKKVGALPIWVDKLAGDTFLHLDSITAYDKTGKIVWSRNLES